MFTFSIGKDFITFKFKVNKWVFGSIFCRVSNKAFQPDI